MPETSIGNGKLMMGLLRDHLELASVELKYAKDKARRRLLGWVAAGLLAVTGYVFLQVALLGGLRALGLGLGQGALLLGVVYALGAFLIIKKFSKSDKQTGSAFQATRDELHRSFNWIEKNLF
jgi:uncharacterized membrane protein YqjE